MTEFKLQDQQLDHELWRRRQNEREGALAATVRQKDAPLLPLALALARLAAQRDAATDRVVKVTRP